MQQHKYHVPASWEEVSIPYVAIYSQTPISNWFRHIIREISKALLAGFETQSVYFPACVCLISDKKVRHLLIPSFHWQLKSTWLILDCHSPMHKARSVMPAIRRLYKDSKNIAFSSRLERMEGNSPISILKQPLHLLD